MAAQRREGLAGYVFLSPWLLGLLAITAIPMLLSLYLSFTNYDLLSPLVRGGVGGLATTTSGCSPTTRPTGTRCG